MEKNDVIIIILIFLTNIISVIATTIVQYYFYRYKQLRVIEFQYILFICTSDQIYSYVMISVGIFALTNLEIPTIYCQIQGFLKIYFALVQFYFTAVVSYTLYENVFKLESAKRYYKFWIIYCFTQPLLFATIPLLNNTYGPVYPLIKASCFITLDNQQPNNHYPYNWTLLGCFLLQLWFVFLVCLYCIISVVREIKSNYNLENENKVLINGLFLYPGILFLCWIWITLDRTLNIFGYENIYFLNYCEYTFIGLCGFLNSAVYAFNTIKQQTDVLQRLNSKESYDCKEITIATRNYSNYDII